MSLVLQNYIGLMEHLIPVIFDEVKSSEDGMIEYKSKRILKHPNIQKITLDSKVTHIKITSTKKNPLDLVVEIIHDYDKKKRISIQYSEKDLINLNKWVKKIKLHRLK